MVNLVLCVHLNSIKIIKKEGGMFYSGSGGLVAKTALESSVIGSLAAIAGLTTLSPNTMANHAISDCAKIRFIK